MVYKRRIILGEELTGKINMNYNNEILIAESIREQNKLTLPKISLTKIEEESERFLEEKLQKVY